ncbi:hypothetical protein ACWD4B_22075 [Streptomyces sp. NPDC002536]
MNWDQAAAYGAIGGGIVEALVWNGYLLAWQAARHEAREGRRRLPPLRKYVDLSADLAAGLSRILLGALMGWLLHPQITGLYAAVAAGASAPALIRQLGSLRTVQAALRAGDPQLGEPSPAPDLQPNSGNTAAR